jgi:hypothetical protein
VDLAIRFAHGAVFHIGALRSIQQNAAKGLSYVIASEAKQSGLRHSGMVR